MNKIKLILLIDDDADDYNLFKIALAEVDKNIECRNALDCEDALSQLRNEEQPLPDLILLDLNMPRVSGKDCLIEFKSDERLRNIPVVIYSTSSYEKDIEETRELGAVDYLMKPSGYRGIVNAITALINTDWVGEEFHYLQF